MDDKANGSQPGGVFTGDTLFIAGCGRFFEGTGDEMNRALSYLGTLPNDTVLYNGHEYTAGNLAFAKSIDRDNKALDKLTDLMNHNSITTGLTTIGDEKEWNVFMRLESEPVQLVIEIRTSLASTFLPMFTIAKLHLRLQRHRKVILWIL